MELYTKAEVSVATRRIWELIQRSPLEPTPRIGAYCNSNLQVFKIA